MKLALVNRSKVCNVALVILICFSLPGPTRAAALGPAYGPADVRAFYPNLNDEDFNIKVEGAADAFHFLRTFVPLYYQILADGKTLSDVGALFSQSGWCVGDAHPENFGILLDDSGDTIFTVNDVDDGGPCPLAADALRFFAAVHLFDSKQDLKELFESYKQGLNGESFKFSDPVKEMAKKAKGKLDPNSSMLADEEHFKRKDGVEDLTDTEAEAVQTAATIKYGVDAKVIDAIKMKKASGGSGGLVRYRALVKLRVDGKKETQVIEFKEIQRPGIFPMAVGKLPSFEARIKKSLEIEEGAAASELFQTAKVLDRQMLLRPRRSGNIGVVLADLKGDELKSVLKDEIAVLGRIHIRSASQLEAYRKTINQLSFDQWESYVKEISNTMEDTFKSMK